MTAKLIISLFCLAAFGVSANAEVRVAIIDLRKVFDDYYKTKAANSQLSDLAADMAKESVSFNKALILQQAGIAVLAQANSLPNGVLRLLQ